MNVVRDNWPFLALGLFMLGAWLMWVSTDGWTDREDEYDDEPYDWQRDEDLARTFELESEEGLLAVWKKPATARTWSERNQEEELWLR